MRVGDLLVRTTERAPDREALVEGDVRLTYRQFHDEARRFGAALHRLGVEPGARVGLLLPNGIPFAVAHFGCLLAGAVSLPLNTRLAGKELEFIINDAQVSALVVHESFHAVWDGIRGSLPMVKHTIAAGGTRTGFHTFEELLAEPATGWTPPPGRPEDVACILYTSGTTGLPKGAMMTHRNILFNNVSCKAHLGYVGSDRTLIVLPMFHVTALNSQLTVFVELGGTMVIMGAYKTQEVIRQLAEHRITCAFLVPTICTLMLISPHLAAADLSALRLIAYAGAPMPTETIAALQARFPGLALVNAYGLTETSSLSTVLPPADAAPRASSVGLPVARTIIRIVGEDGRDLPPGTVGELWIKGGQVVPGYFNRPEATAQAVTDGWLHTGDLGKLDEDGYVYVVDRKKDMINRGGEKVFSIEVEEILNAHPKVLESAVVPHPDRIFGEVVKAVCVLRPGEQATVEEIIGFCRTRLADYKVPVHVRFVEELPRNPGGKVLKGVLKTL
ncbi:MAG TPA: long-chain-fatty-acid--CoA ligase [Methylomirabilota bacterium]|jgi:acyl-CoA synthetase (AMP-forming)/AMP-acid ligase II|nr:long-chain-fatty-acid--CoA ligase [Methylomirabilota bacterium]